MKCFNKFSCIIVLLVFFASCKKTEEPSYQTESEAKAILNLSYGADPKQVMDVYLPPNRSTNTSVIIFVHGGSFIGGDKNDFSAHARYLAGSGYAVLNVNYRLVDASGIFDYPTRHKESQVKVKNQVDDISAIVDFAISQARSWVVSGTRIGIAGHSAGATLAMLYSYDARNANKVQAVSNVAGALDLQFTNVANWQYLPAYILEGGFRYTGFKVEVANEPHYKAISPMFTLNERRLVPTLSFFPEYNNVDGLPKQDFNTFNKFTSELNKFKVPNELVFLKGADHNLTRVTDWEIALNKTVAYFNEHIQ